MKINFPILYQVLIFLPGNNLSNTDLTSLANISSAGDISAVASD